MAITKIIDGMEFQLVATGISMYGEDLASGAGDIRIFSQARRGSISLPQDVVQIPIADLLAKYPEGPQLMQDIKLAYEWALSQSAQPVEEPLPPEIIDGQ